ncbi:MAG: rod shape-determining protein MreC [Actinomycetia bacterium]|nr:rod shape-determining protein MreC [Actinomycetes bacterium]
MRVTLSEPKRGNPTLLAVLVVASLVLITVYFREGDTGLLHKAREATLTVTAPLSKVGTAVAKPFEAVGDWIAGFGVSRSEVEQLRQQNAQMRAQLAQLEEERKQYERISSLVQFAEQRKFTQLGARVIGRPTSNWEGVITIDRGTADGVEPGMAVIAAQGLVGQIDTVSAHASRVRLVTDEQSGVAAMIQRTRAVGVVNGSIDRTLHMDFVDKAKLPKVGDVVMTSGLGGVYPKGIVIGDVIDVDARRADLFPRITVASRVPITELEEVLVLLGPVSVESTGAVE